MRKGTNHFTLNAQAWIHNSTPHWGGVPPISVRIIGTCTHNIIGAAEHALKVQQFAIDLDLQVGAEIVQFDLTKLWNGPRAPVHIDRTNSEFSSAGTYNMW